jgi:protocatechuate 3,4-dioxygenase beta subunit
MRRNCLSVSCLSLTIIFIAGLAQAQSEQAKQITCTGKVVDDQNRPIAGVKVALHEMVYSPTANSYDSKLIGEVTTSADGAFSFSTSAETDVYRYGYIVAEKEGLALGFAVWRIREGDKKLEIELGRPEELSGVVVDENDKPVADAQVSIAMLSIGTMQEDRGVGGPLAIELFTSTTDTAGKFKFTKIPPNATAEFIMKKDGRATVGTYKNTGGADQKLNFAAGQADIKLVLPIEAKIEGIVVQKDTGKPVSGVQLTARSEQVIPYFRQKPLVPNEDGKFSINALASGRYTLGPVQSTDELADWVAEPVEVMTEAGKTVSDVKIELSKGGILEVAVTEAVSKQPVEKASVGVQNPASNQYHSSRSDKDGIARIRLMPGEYQMSSVYKQGYSQQRIQDTVTIEDGKTERLEYELAGMPKITGVVRDERGKSLEGVKLRVCPMGGSQDATTDAEGRFEAVYDLGGWGGRGTPIMFLVGRYETGNLAAAVEIEEDASQVDIILKPAVTFTGRVVDPDGKGIASARITIMLRVSSWGSSIGRDRITTDEQGKFEIKAIPTEHKYSLYVVAEGYGEIRKEEISTDDAVNNHLDIGALILAVANLSVSGVVVDNDGKPVAGARIYCYGEGQSRSRAETDIEGKFTLEKVCAGRIRINADKSGTTRLYGNIETEGGATDVRVVISERPSSTRYEPKQPPSLVGRPLPDLKEVGIDLPPGDADGKMLLVCFFDMEQRPSRHCITQLAKQAEQLKGKGVTIVAVQASNVDKNTLDEWVKKSNVPFSVGMVQDEAEKARFAWGVRSLPWLILTDTSHIVRAAGFPFKELNDKLGQTDGG